MFPGRCPGPRWAFAAQTRGAPGCPRSSARHGGRVAEVGVVAGLPVAHPEGAYHTRPGASGVRANGVNLVLTRQPRAGRGRSDTARQEAPISLGTAIYIWDHLVYHLRLAGDRVGVKHRLLTLHVSVRRGPAAWSPPRVPGVVQSRVANASLLQKPFPGVMIGARVDRLAVRSSEHPVARMPQLPGCLPSASWNVLCSRSAANNGVGIPTACRPARDLRSTSRIPPPWRCGQADACRTQSGGHGGGHGRACRRHGEGHGSILCSRLATFVGVVASVQPAMTLNLRLSALIDSDRLMDVNAGKRQPRVDARPAPS